MYRNKLLLAASVMLSLNSFTAQAGLVTETSAGQQVVYDNVNNYTWTADANLLGTLENTYTTTTIINNILAATYNSTLKASVVNDTNNSLDNKGAGTYQVSAADFNANGVGTTDYWGAKAFTVYLNSIAYAGSTQWALPTTSPNNAGGFGFYQTSSQLGDLYYNQLLGDAFTPPSTTPFSNLQTDSTLALTTDYWSATEWVDGAANAWYFDANTGIQNYAAKNTQFYVLEVSAGNPVPEPGILWLLSTGLGLLAVKTRRVK